MGSCSRRSSGQEEAGSADATGEGTRHPDRSHWFSPQDQTPAGVVSCSTKGQKVNPLTLLATRAWSQQPETQANQWREAVCQQSFIPNNGGTWRTRVLGGPVLAQGFR